MKSAPWKQLKGEDDMTISEKIELLREKIENTDAVMIGAGAGLSTSAGFTYSGEDL